MTMLIVDDESEICLLLQAILASSGVGSKSAGTLAEAKRLLVDHEFSGAFLDVNLPDGRGYELIPELKRRYPSIRVIMISAMDDERGRAIEAGADLFISKPLDRRTILASLSSSGVWQ